MPVSTPEQATRRKGRAGYALDPNSRQLCFEAEGNPWQRVVEGHAERGD